MLADAERGILPVAGGMQEQPVRFVHAFRMMHASGWYKFAKNKEEQDGTQRR